MSRRRWRPPARRWWRSPAWRRRHPGPVRHCSWGWRGHPRHWRSSSHGGRGHWVGARGTWRQWGAGHEALARHHVGRGRHHVGRRRHRSHGGQWGRRSVSKQLVRSVCLGERILGSQQPLCCRAVSLPLGVLLECVGDRDGSVAQILPWR